MVYRYFIGTLIITVIACGLAETVQANTRYFTPAVGEVSTVYPGKERVVIANDRLVVFSATGKRVTGFPVSENYYSLVVSPALADIDGDGIKEIVVYGVNTVSQNAYVVVYNGSGVKKDELVLPLSTPADAVFHELVVIPDTTGQEMVALSTDTGRVFTVSWPAGIAVQKEVAAVTGRTSVVANQTGTELYLARWSEPSLQIYGRTGASWTLKKSLSLPQATTFATFDISKNRWYGVGNSGSLMAIDGTTKQFVAGWPIDFGIVAGPPIIADILPATGNEIVGVLEDGRRVAVNESGTTAETGVRARSVVSPTGEITEPNGLFSWNKTTGKVYTPSFDWVSNYYSRLRLPNIVYVVPPHISNLTFGTPEYGDQATMTVSATVSGQVAIAATEYYVVDKNNQEVSRVSLVANDGAFNGNTESVSGVISFTDWNADATPYTIRVVATDAVGTMSVPVAREFTVLDHTDSDNTVDGFGGGNKTNVVWNNKLMLDSAGLAAGNGSFTSRIMDAGQNTVWNQLAWNPQYPYGKPLPVNGQKETGYPTGNVDMSGNVLLYHFENGVTDSSGKNSNGVWQDVEQYVSGVFGSAARVNPGYITAGASDDFKIAKNITVEAWVNPSDSAAYKTIIMRDGSYYFALNALKPAVFLNGVNGAWQQATVAVPQNTWSHVAFSYDGSVLKIFINGVMNRTINLPGNIATPTGKAVWIGNRPENLVNYRFAGALDEVSIMNRVLTPGEIFAHYRRGMFTAKFQVRACAEGNCSDADFVGPDNTANTYYSEVHNQTTGLPNITLSGLEAQRFFQYRVLYETRLKTFGPEITRVTIGPGHISTGEIIPPVTSASVDQTDDDNTATGFGGGLTTATEWSTDGLVLTAAGKTAGHGEFESRIINAAETVTWNSLTWKPFAPYGKPLPNNAGKETQYAMGNVDMRNNVLLAHFEDVAGVPVVDSSGQVQVGVTAGTTAPQAMVPGIVGSAIQFDGTDDKVLFGSGSNLAISGPLTLEAWVYPTGSSGYQSIVARDSGYYLALTNLRPAVYLQGVSKPGWHHATTVLPLNSWSHVVATYDGSTVTIYINGRLDATVSSVTGAISVPAGKELWVGNRPEPNYAFRGRLDELAVYARALTPTEIMAHYERAVLRLKFQVRACATATCAGVAYGGVDGTANTYITDISTTALPTVHFTTPLSGQYFQYRAWLETSGTVSPKLGTVKVGPAHSLAN